MTFELEVLHLFHISCIPILYHVLTSNRFQGVSDVYKTVAENPILGMEQPGNRKRGKTVEDVVELLSEGMDDAKRGKKQKVDRT